MKDRGKRTATERKNEDVSLYYSTPSELSCRKHPSVSPVGICPYCLSDRLVNLLCSECGEQRLSSCSCSDTSPNHAAVDAGNVRISSLINEETKKQRKTSRKTEEVVVLKRSSSSCIEIRKRKHHRFSRLGRFLRKISPRKEKAFDENNPNNDNDNDSWCLDYKNDRKTLRVSRSRSLCSFRGGNGYLVGSEEDVSSYSGARSSFSAARSSSVFDTTTEHRRSNFEGRKSNFSETTDTRRSNFSESEPPRRSCFEARKSNFSETEYPRRSNFSETEYNRRVAPAMEISHPRRSNYEAAPRKSNVNEEQHRKSDSSAMSFTRRVLSVKESYFTGGEETGFIDLKFDSSGRVGGEVVVNDGVLMHGGGSCRLTTKDREVSKSRRSFKGWKWIFGHHLHLHHRQRDS